MPSNVTLFSAVLREKFSPEIVTSSPEYPFSGLMPVTDMISSGRTAYVNLTVVGAVLPLTVSPTCTSPNSCSGIVRVSLFLVAAVTGTVTPSTVTTFSSGTSEKYSPEIMAVQPTYPVPGTIEMSLGSCSCSSTGPVCSHDITPKRAAAQKIIYLKILFITVSYFLIIAHPFITALSLPSVGLLMI